MAEDTKLGMICRCDKSGLGIQTRRLARLLKPDWVMLIDSSPFNGAEQYPNWYKDYNVINVNGFPLDDQVRAFLESIDTVISCETFYSNHFTEIARDMRVKTVLIANPEFTDWLKPEWEFKPRPNLMLIPSLWMYELMTSRFDAIYIPTPIFDDEFKKVRQANLRRTGRKFLFMNGKTAVEDRNGLESLYRALELSKGKFTVTVKAQNDVKRHPDPRLIYDFTNPELQEDLYKGYDCLILPRRYGGQALSMTEALTCGLPVIMTDIEPNNNVLPPEWLVPAYKSGELMTRIMIDVYSADAKALADKLDTIDLSKKAKWEAVEISKQYEAESLRRAYEVLLSSL